MAEAFSGDSHQPPDPFSQLDAQELTGRAEEGARLDRQVVETRDAMQQGDSDLQAFFARRSAFGRAVLERREFDAPEAPQSDQPPPDVSR